MLTVKQLAEKLNISSSKVYALISGGEIAHFRIGGSIRVSEEQVEQYLTRVERGEAETSLASAPPPPKQSLTHLKID